MEEVLTMRKSAETFKCLDAKSLRSSHEETLTFLISVKECIDKGETQELKDIIYDEEYKGLVEYIAWDLLPILGPHLQDRETNMYDNCVEMVSKLAELGNSKEMFIGLLEQVDGFLDTKIHSDYLRLLQIVIKRLGITKPLYYNQLLSTLYCHVKTLQVPSVNGLGIMERRLMRQDTDFSTVEVTTLYMLDFLGPLVKDVEEALVVDAAGKNYSGNEIIEIERTRTELMKFTLNLLEHPLIAVEFKYLDDAEDEEQEETNQLDGIDAEAKMTLAPPNDDNWCNSKTYAQQCMFYLDSMGCNFSNLVLYANQGMTNFWDEKGKRKAKMKTELEETDEESLPMLGLGCFVYMLLVDGYDTHRMPSVYSTEYMFTVVMPYVEAMLRRSEEPIVVKGIELLNSLVDKLEDQSLEASIINVRGNYLHVCNCLVQVMILCQSKSVRKLSVQLLPTFIGRFDWKGRFKLLRGLLLDTDHSGVKGMLIGIIKDYVHSSLQSESPNCWFAGNHTLDLYKIIFKLDHGINTDLLDDGDRHTGSLNFLRYLLLRDKPERNDTGVWTQLDWIQADYLKPLRTCLDMSAAHYENRLQLTENEMRTAAIANKNVKGILQIGKEKLPQMPLSEQVKVLKLAQNTFDLIASILGRIGEIISAASDQRGS